MARPTPLQKTLAELFDAQPNDQRLRDHLEGLTRDENFPGLTWFWGPYLYERNRAIFRSLITQHFSSWQHTGWRWKRIKWSAHADRLEPWLAAARKNRDTQLVHMLLLWRHALKHWGIDRKAWTAALLADYQNAPTAADRAIVLQEYDAWFDLSEADALAMYQCDPQCATFLLRHLPLAWSFDNKRVLWQKLSEAALANGDEELHFRLYRKQVPLKQWRTDILSLAQRTPSPQQLNAELKRHHPEGYGLNFTDTIVELLKARGRDVMPYVKENLDTIVRGPQRNAALPLLQLAEQNEWWDLWSGLLRKDYDSERFNAAIEKLLDDSRIREADRIERLKALAGVSREWNWIGFGLVITHALDDDLAARMYRQYPDLIRGPFQPNTSTTWHIGYPKLLAAAQAAEDDEQVDRMASRLATRPRPLHQYYGYKDANKVVDLADQLGADYQQLREQDPHLFARRAANILTRMPAYAIYDYPQLLRSNQLARLLFVRSFDAYLTVPETIRDLVEGSEIRVQMLGYRVLAQDDPRAQRLAAETIDILLGTLFRPLHRKTRIAAFGALLSAAKGDAEAAAKVLAKARQALKLPDNKYPKEHLIGLIGKVLHLRPELRGEGEQPIIFGFEEATA